MTTRMPEVTVASSSSSAPPPPPPYAVSPEGCQDACVLTREWIRNAASQGYPLGEKTEAPCARLAFRVANAQDMLEEAADSGFIQACPECVKVLTYLYRDRGWVPLPTLPDGQAKNFHELVGELLFGTTNRHYSAVNAVSDDRHAYKEVCREARKRLIEYAGGAKLLVGDHITRQVGRRTVRVRTRLEYQFRNVERVVAALHGDKCTTETCPGASPRKPYEYSCATHNNFWASFIAHAKDTAPKVSAALSGVYTGPPPKRGQVRVYPADKNDDDDVLLSIEATGHIAMVESAAAAAAAAGPEDARGMFNISVFATRTLEGYGDFMSLAVAYLASSASISSGQACIRHFRVITQDAAEAAGALTMYGTAMLLAENLLPAALEKFPRGVPAKATSPDEAAALLRLALMPGRGAGWLTPVHERGQVTPTIKSLRTLLDLYTDASRKAAEKGGTTYDSIHEEFRGMLGYRKRTYREQTAPPKEGAVKQAMARVASDAPSGVAFKLPVVATLAQMQARNYRSLVAIRPLKLEPAPAPALSGASARVTADEASRSALDGLLGSGASGKRAGGNSTKGKTGLLLAAAMLSESPPVTVRVPYPKNPSSLLSEPMPVEDAGRTFNQIPPSGAALVAWLVAFSKANPGVHMPLEVCNAYEGRAAQMACVPPEMSAYFSTQEVVHYVGGPRSACDFLSIAYGAREVSAVVNIGRGVFISFAGHAGRHFGALKLARHASAQTGFADGDFYKETMKAHGEGRLLRRLWGGFPPEKSMKCDKATQQVLSAFASRGGTLLPDLTLDGDAHLAGVMFAPDLHALHERPAYETPLRLCWAKRYWLTVDRV